MAANLWFIELVNVETELEIHLAFQVCQRDWDYGQPKTDFLVVISEQV